MALRNNPNTLGVGMCTKNCIVAAVPSVLKTAIIPLGTHANIADTPRENIPPPQIERST
jgi:hypothetical protein